jgi:uncharacterized protein with NRDE domain
MCTILFSYKTTPGYRLVLAANRDEFMNRQTAPLAYWQDSKEVLAGRDLQQGGTWLGLDAKGRIGAITNFREPQTVSAEYPSRGEILSNYLAAKGSEADFFNDLEVKASKYRGFNLLFGTSDTMYYYSNRLEKKLQLKPGIYGLSNHLLDSDWPKVARGKMLLTKVIKKGIFKVEDIFSILCDNYQPPEEFLPDTGIGKVWERLLASIFITSEFYGTRSSAVITIRDDGYTEFRERTFLHSADGWQAEGEKCYTLNGS